MESTVNSRQIDTKYVDVLDGIRALSILLVFWFHLWQQNWIMPVFQVPFLRKLGLSGTINLDFIPRSSYLYVDMMLLLSAFCLFLPHARAVFLGEPVPDTRAFYKKRAIRIIPPYYLSVFIIFVFVALPSGAYTSARALCMDLFSTLTFTQVFIPAIFIGTKLNIVLWTAAVEMQFYLLFPLLARCFRKRPLLTYLAMVSVSMLYLQFYVLGHVDGIRTSLNQLPAFFGVFANGMLFSYGFVWLSTKIRRTRLLSIVATLAAFGCILWILRLQKAAPGTDPVQVWQAANRYQLSVAFSLFLLSSALAAKWLRFLLSNRVMRFLALISYNLYIWHQWLFVKLKEWRIPYWAGEQPPNFTGDRIWQWRYTAICILAAFAVAILVTYLFERPVTRFLQNGLYRSAPRRPMIEIERDSTMHYTYKPSGVCSTKIEFDIGDDHTLHNVVFTSGCNGNLKAIGKLVEGKDASEIAALLSGNTCGFNKTSCADQLAKAIEEAEK